MSMVDDDFFDPYGYVLAFIGGIGAAVYGAWHGWRATSVLYWLLAALGVAFVVWGVYRLGTRNARHVVRVSTAEREAEQRRRQDAAAQPQQPQTLTLTDADVVPPPDRPQFPRRPPTPL